MCEKPRIWSSLLTKEDQEVITKGGYGKSRGLGNHPIIVVVDMQYNYLGENKPILDQIGNWPSGGGENGWKALENSKKLLCFGRENNMPILYTRNVQQDLQFDSFSNRTDRDQSRYLNGHRGTEIVDELKPREGELVLDKAYASAFYSTPLLSWLVNMRIDTLLIAGGSTSGCVRATAVDAVSRNFNVAVIEECVYDRISISHKAGLLDLWMKYCEVLPLQEVLDRYA